MYTCPIDLYERGVYARNVFETFSCGEIYGSELLLSRGCRLGRSLSSLRHLKNVRRF